MLFLTLKSVLVVVETDRVVGALTLVDGNPMFDNAELGLNFVDSISHPRRRLDQQNQVLHPLLS